jgi:hypothetical protein
MEDPHDVDGLFDGTHGADVWALIVELPEDGV